ncbi:MAG: DEAD/DEAH box helicase [Phycisphaerales bacterium]|nr:DEAD/DEAH box helicase [Phycisphaerales bacterium]
MNQDHETTTIHADNSADHRPPAPPEPVADPAHASAAPPPHKLKGDEIFSEKTFTDLGLRSSVVKGVDAMGFKHPTAIQAQLIPVALSGRDILGQAKTGTGKTAAFGLPLFHMATRELPFQTLILAPTRELAIQIAAELSELGKFTPIRGAAIYGGQRISAQMDKLRRDPEIIVGTPGRIMDMVERGHIHFRNIKFVVLDEVDRMLDIGFREDIRRILSQCPKERQTIFVSATIAGDIEKLARQYMRDPVKLVSSSASLTVDLVQQFHLPVAPWDKRRLLRHLLTHEEPALTVVFCRLKRTCDELARGLSEKGIDAHAIHGDLPQGKRNKIMEKLRGGSLEVLIASDLASRGLDVEGISHVINYDLPDDVDLYVHRIGRTARAGRGGVAWSFVTPEQGSLLTQIEQLINTEIPKLDYPDFEPGPLPDWAQRERREKQVSNDSKMTRLETHKQELHATIARPDPEKFPGGIVPTKLPPKRMHGRIRSSRGR